MFQKLKALVSIKKKPITLRQLSQAMGMLAVIQFLILIVVTCFPERSPQVGLLAFICFLIAMALLAESLEGNFQSANMTSPEKYPDRSSSN